MVSLAAVLLVCYAAVCASQLENDLTTASQLGEEIKSLLEEARLCTCVPQNCSSLREELVAEIQRRVTDSVKAAVSRTIEDLLESKLSHLFLPGYTPSHSASSCQQILKLAPQSPSGFYWIRGADSGLKHMYCDMERSCKGVAGGWMRVASINMTDTSSSCPPGLRTITRPRRLCAKNTGGSGCSSVVLPLQGIQYSRVCGKIIGYQKSSTDAFRRFISGQNTLDTNYVDGISITHGQNPRKHIWTLAVAVHEHEYAPESQCPCTNTNNTPPPPSVPGFVGNDYFCDTGSRDWYQSIFYGDDPLWDGAGCGQNSVCCEFNSPPWFRKEISPPTNDDIEARLCTDQAQSDEDVYIEIIEIYVQ